jgi:hypothetical protein
MLFILEQLTAITVFAFCAAVCSAAFVYSYKTAENSKARDGAIIAAQSAAECFKAASGDVRITALRLGGTVSVGAEYVGVESVVAEYVAVRYDMNWRVCEERDAAYLLTLTARPPVAAGRLAPGEISVVTAENKELMSVAVTARTDYFE